MSTIRSFVSLVLRPIFALCVLLLGVACIFVSAYMEVEVFKAILLSGENAGQSLLVPAIVVGAFESSKIFLAFLRRRGSTLIPVGLQRFAYAFFVTVSFICTLIYFINPILFLGETVNHIFPTIYFLLIFPISLKRLSSLLLRLSPRTKYSPLSSVTALSASPPSVIS